MLTIHVKNFALGDALFSTYQRAATAARLIHKGILTMDEHFCLSQEYFHLHASDNPAKGKWE